MWHPEIRSSSGRKNSHIYVGAYSVSSRNIMRPFVGSKRLLQGGRHVVFPPFTEVSTSKGSFTVFVLRFSMADSFLRLPPS